MHAPFLVCERGLACAVEARVDDVHVVGEPDHLGPQLVPLAVEAQTDDLEPVEGDPRAARRVGRVQVELTCRAFEDERKQVAGRRRADLLSLARGERDDVGVDRNALYLTDLKLPERTISSAWASVSTPPKPEMRVTAIFVPSGDHAGSRSDVSVSSPVRPVLTSVIAPPAAGNRMDAVGGFLPVALEGDRVAVGRPGRARPTPGRR